MVICSLLYYADQVYLLGIQQLSNSFFNTVHDLHRTLFFIPILYASLVFRIRGAMITSFAFLCITIPRALLISPYPDPLLRPVVFVTIAAFIGFIIATQFNRIERETKANAAMSAAYDELNKTHQQLKESQEQLIQAEKLSLLGQMAASFVHEAKNPVAAAIVLTRIMRKDINQNGIIKDTAMEYLLQIESSLARSNTLIQNVLDFSRQSSPKLELCNTNDIVDQSLHLTAHMAKSQSVTVIKELNYPMPDIMSDSDQLQQVYVNLILNAIQAMPDGGKLTIRTFTDGDNWLKTEIKDTGHGISKENLDNLFTPFFTTKEKGKGVGLGLFICNEIIQRHKGRIEVKSKEGSGTTFIVSLPMNGTGNKEISKGVNYDKGKLAKLHPCA